MATFVLVHGAWGSGPTWREFVPHLASKGHEVYTPTLTGLGDRYHLGRPDTNLTTHIEDIVGLIAYEDLHEIALVGYSYGGMVVTGVADRVPERIAQLVYIDAALPRDGESMRGINPLITSRVDKDGWRVLPNLPQPYLRSQPTATFEEKLTLSVPLEKRGFTRTFIRATSGGIAGAKAATRVKDDPDWRYFELACGHLVHRERPEELAAILDAIVR